MSFEASRLKIVAALTADIVDCTIDSRKPEDGRNNNGGVGSD